MHGTIHLFARNYAEYSPVLKNFTDRLSNKPFLISLLKIPPHLKYVTTVPSNIHVSLITALVHNCRSFSDIIVSQGNVATHMRCSGIFNKHFAANLLENLKVKFFLENCLRINRVTAISLVYPFLEHGVHRIDWTVSARLVLKTRILMRLFSLEFG